MLAYPMKRFSKNHAFDVIYVSVFDWLNSIYIHALRVHYVSALTVLAVWKQQVNSDLV